MTLTGIENWAIAYVKALFGTALNQVGSLPVTLDAQSFERILSGAPGVFIVFAGGKPSPAGTTNANMMGRWVFAAVTDHKGKEVTRRQGDLNQIGAYDIIGRLITKLHGVTVPGVGTWVFSGVSNLFADALDLKGCTVYGVDMDLPMEFDPNDLGGDSSLDNFLHFKDSWLPTLGDGHEPATNDDVELPAP
jgi:phage gp37-like protein